MENNTPQTENRCSICYAIPAEHTSEGGYACEKHIKLTPEDFLDRITKLKEKEEELARAFSNSEAAWEELSEEDRKGLFDDIWKANYLNITYPMLFGDTGRIKMHEVAYMAVALLYQLMKSYTDLSKPQFFAKAVILSAMKLDSELMRKILAPKFKGDK